MARGLLALLAIPMLLALACGRGEDAAPVIDPEPRATGTSTATPAGAAQGAAPTAAATSSATPQPAPVAPSPATSTPTATPAPAATRAPSPPAATVTGPLLVFSETVEVERGRPQWGRTETRRVHVYDVSTDRYWVAFDYPHAVQGSGVERSDVQVARESLVVWSENEVRRVGLDGETESVLLERDQISWVEVSPDGTRVAIVYGADPAAVLVVDIATGRELLDTGRRFDPVFVGSPRDLRQRWHADGAALLVAEGGAPGLLRLDGTFEALPEEWHVAPDLRHALRPGERIGAIVFNRHQSRSVWESLDVLDVETGEVLWTVRAEEGGGLYRHVDYAGDGWWGPSVAREPAWEDRRHVFFKELAPGPDWREVYYPDIGVLKVLDAATGDVRPLTPEFEGRLRGRVSINCDPWPSVRTICHDGRVIWEGAFRHLGVVEPDGGIDLRGVTLLARAVEPDPPPPPPREEIAGPLLLYEVFRPHPAAPRLAVAYDEGTGRSWALHRRSDDPYCRPQAARGGLVTCSRSELLYVAADGETRILDDRRPRAFLVSPDGRRVAVRHDAGDWGPDGRHNPAGTLVLDVPSGDEVLRVVHDGIPAAAALPPAMIAWTAYLEAWTSDSSAVVFLVIDDDTGYGGPASGVIGRLDGTLHRAPCPANDYEGVRCLAPDGRHVVRGRSEVPGEYTERYWRNVDIIDVATGEVRWSVAPSAVLDRRDWEWASPWHFAWSDALLPRVYPAEFSPDARAGKDDDVSVLDVRTGETELLDVPEYVARFHPRARADCPVNPGHACRILLDGEAVGEGRWPAILGLAELD